MASKTICYPLSCPHWRTFQVAMLNYAGMIVLAFSISLGLTTSLSNAGTMEFIDDFSGATLNPYWEVSNGNPNAEIVQKDGLLTITSEVAPVGEWLDTRIASVDPIPLSDFTASVDFRIPQGRAMPWLLARPPLNEANDSHMFGVYLFNGSQYNVWFRNDETTGSRGGPRSFGDEATNWHNLKLEYEADLMTVTAYVDELFVYSTEIDLSNSHFVLNLKDRNSYGPGPTVIEFDNFHLSYTPVPEPTSLLLSTLALILVNSLRRRK